MTGSMPVGSRPSHSNQRFPLALFEPHRRRAEINHGQSLERLADFGGLSWAEALAILEDRTVFAGPTSGVETMFRKLVVDRQARRRR